MKIEEKTTHPISRQSAVSANWEFRPLEEVADILDRRRIPVNSKERESRVGNVPYYGATGQVGWIDDYLFDEELVLLGEDGAPFLDPNKPKAYLVRGKSWVNNHAHVLRGRTVPNAWLAYYLNSIHYDGLVSGTTRLKLTQAAMRQIMVPVTFLPTMLSIVAEIEKQFSRLDEAVTGLKRVKANLKRYKAAVLKAAVEGRLVETETEIACREGRSYETGEQLLQRILETRRSQWKGKGKYKEPIAPDTTDLPELPEGWAWVSVDQLASDSLIGLDRGRDQQNTEGVGTPYVKMNNVTMEGQVTGEGLVYVDASNAEKTRFNLQEGDLLFNTRNSKELVGKVGIVSKLPMASIYNNNLMRLRIVDGAMPFFVCSQMCSVGFRKRMELVKKATTNVAAVYAKDLFSLPLALPPLDEQQRIVTEVDRHLSLSREAEHQVDTNLKRAERMRQCLLQRAFTGTLAVQD